MSLFANKNSTPDIYASIEIEEDDLYLMIKGQDNKNNPYEKQFNLASLVLSAINSSKFVCDDIDKAISFKQTVLEHLRKILSEAESFGGELDQLKSKPRHLW